MRRIRDFGTDMDKRIIGGGTSGSVVDRVIEEQTHDLHMRIYDMPYNEAESLTCSNFVDAWSLVYQRHDDDDHIRFVYIRIVPKRATGRKSSK